MLFTTQGTNAGMIIAAHRDWQSGITHPRLAAIRWCEEGEVKATVDCFVDATYRIHR